MKFETKKDKLEENRIISICTEIEPGMADQLMKDLLIMDKENHKPITLYINSPGGDVVSGLQIIDTMNSIQSQVDTVCTGQCASMAAVILSAGKKRMILPHARVMIHQVSSGTRGKVFNMEVDFEEAKRLNDISMGILAKNCSKALEQLKEDTHVDFYMGAEEALKYGIVDEIVGQRG